MKFNYSNKTPKTLFRWIPKEYEKNFFEDGDFMVSTLYDCRSLENAERKDAEEGSKTLLEKIGYKNKESSIPINFRNEKGEEIDDAKYFYNVEFSNAYVVCFEQAYRMELKTDKMTCLEIVETDSFLKRLSDNLHKKSGLGFVIYAKCLYADKISDLGSDFLNFAFLNPWIFAFVKPLRFKHENEFRLFASNGDITKPVLQVKERTASYLYRIKVDDFNFPKETKGDIVNGIERQIVTDLNLIDYVKKVDNNVYKK